MGLCIFSKNSYIFIEPCGTLENKDIGLFKYNNEFLIRRLIFKNGKFILGMGSDSSYDNEDFRVFMLRIMKFFKARSAWCEIIDGKLYIGILTEEKLYSDFSLIRQNMKNVTEK